MFSWMDFARKVLSTMDRKIERALRSAGINQRTIDASVLRGELDSSVKIGGTAGRVAIFDASGALNSDAGLLYDAATNRLETVGGMDSGGSVVITLATGNVLVVDENVLVVDATNDRVGIKNAAPARTLEIGAFFAPAGVTSAEITLSEDVNGITGMEFRNLSAAGTDADSRFAVSDTGGHYLAFAMPGLGNTGGTIFGKARATTAFIFNAGGTARDLAIGAFGAKSLTLGTNNAARQTILSTGEIGIGTVTPAVLLHSLLTDTAASTISEVLRIGHNTTQPATHGFGTRVLFQLEASGNTPDQDAAAIEISWITGTSASRAAQGKLFANYTTTARECFAWGANSTTSLVGFHGTAPVAKSTGWSVTAGYTADRAFNPETAAVLEVARVLGTLIDYLISRGDLGA